MKREEAREGDIACFYAEKNFLKVKQAFGIDKVCFSFVKKGTKGDGVNIYIPVDEFDLLCDKILNLSLHKKIAEEKAKKVEYPGAYSCTVGKDGSKKICIGAGKSLEVCIQGSVKKDGKANNIFIGTTYKDLVIMAKWWQRCSVPYYDSMVADIYNASMRKPSAEDVEDSTPAPQSAPAKPATKPTPTAKPQASQQKPVEQQQPKPVPEAKQQQAEEVKLLSVVNTTSLEPMKKKGEVIGYACQIEQAGRKLPPIVFYNDVVKTVAQFSAFKQKIDEGRIPFSVACTPITIGEKSAYKFVRFL